MSQLFFQVLRLSETAVWVIVCVLLARLLLKAAPRRFSYLLWAVVLLRLLCPLSLESPLSLLPAAQLGQVSAVVSAESSPAEQGSTTAFSPVATPGAADPAAAARPDWSALLYRCGPSLWLSGMAALLLYSLLSLARLRRRLRVSLPLGDGVWLADDIRTPFVLGLLRSRIYLPSSLAEEEREYILLHERTHIRRGDHFIKLAAFLALVIHWFNPLVWLAFYLSCQDMEASCDERVLALSPGDIRGAYGASLLRLASGQRVAAAMPLAFGEGRTGSRVKNVLRYKKPAFWLSALAVLAVAVLAICLLTNRPAQTDPAQVVGEYDASTLGGAFLSRDDPAYAIGANAYGMPVFVDTAAAWAAMTRDCAQGLALLAESYDLPPLDQENYAWYKSYGIQTYSEDESLSRQCVEISQFLDLYENSFSSHRPTGTASTPAASGSYDVSVFLGQCLSLNFQPLDGSAYDRIILNNYRLTVIHADGRAIFTSSGNSVSQMVPQALAQRLAEQNVQLLEGYSIPAYDSIDDMMVYTYYADEEQSEVAYCVYWFNGTPTWFTEGDNLRIYQLSAI